MTSTVLSSAGEDYDLRKAWDNACRSFVATTKNDLARGPAQTPEDVIAQLTLRRQAGEAKQAEFKVLKEVLGKSLKLIQTLGAVVSQGAGMAFGPSTLCYSAVSYLITAGQNYKNIYASLGQLFDQVSNFLERFVVYIKMKEIDKSLHVIIHQFLISFVAICELSVKVLHSNRVVKFLKVFAFNEDDGVSAAIRNLKALVERESHMKTTLTYQMAKEGFSETQDGLIGIRATVEKIARHEQQRETETMDGKHIEKIRSKLGAEQDVDEQLKMHRQFLSEKIPGTGEWTQHDPYLLQWTDRSSSWDKILFISADAGYGKSFVVTTILHDLEKRYTGRPQDTARTAISYFYVNASQEISSVSGASGTQVLMRALKALALQLVQEPVYRKDLLAICGNWIEADSPEELFSRLFAPCFRSHETFYLVIDGYEQMGPRNGKTLLEILGKVQSSCSSEQLARVRILIAGRTQMVTDLTASVSLDMEIVDLVSRSQPDINLFIADGLKTLDFLQGASKKVQELRQEIFTRLSEGAHGDYVNVDLLLRELSTKRWPAEIRTLLASNSQRSDTIAREIKRCNQELEARDLQDLNTLLTWVMTAKRTLTVEELEAVLFLKNGETPLKSLYEQLRIHSAFFNVQKKDQLDPKDASVTMVSDSVHEYFRNLPKLPGGPWQKSTIHPSEARIVQRLLGSMLDEDLYQKFGFDAFFQQTLSSGAPSVHVDLDTAHQFVLLDCLQALIRSVPVELDPIHEYAATFFVKHLREVDYASVDNATKSRMGQALVALFGDEEVINQWWTPTSLAFFGRDWFSSRENVDVVLSWLKDPAVNKDCSEEHRSWIEKLTSNSFPDADLLENIATYLARCFFQDPNADLDSLNLLRLLSTFLYTLRLRKDGMSNTETRGDIATKRLSVDDIDEVSDWAAGRLNQQELDFEWTCCKAKAFRLFQHWRHSVQWYQRAASLQDDHWLSDAGLAGTYACMRDWGRAAALYEDILRRIEGGLARTPSPKDYIGRILYAVALCSLELGRYDDALIYCDQRLAITADDYTATLEKILALERLGSYHSLLLYLRQLRLETDPVSGISRLSMTFHENFDGDELFFAVMIAGQKTEEIPFVESALRRAIAEASELGYLPRNPSRRAQYKLMMTYWLADVLYKQPQNPEDRSEAIALWESCLEDAVAADLASVGLLARKSLAAVYSDKLCEAGPESAPTFCTLNKILELNLRTTAQMELISDTIDTRLLVGRYYSRSGRDEDAKDCLRAVMKVGIDLLSDDDPENDWQGYVKLATVLNHYGDNVNALAAWSMVGPHTFTQALLTQPTEADLAETSDTSENDEKGLSDDTDGHVDKGEVEQIKVSTLPKALSNKESLAGPIEWSCDGAGCLDHFWTYASDMWICKDCLDMVFSSACHQQLLDSGLNSKMCNARHEFLHVPPWDEEEAKARGPTRVRRRGSMVPVSEWISEIRQDWQLPAP